jgi:hypothetical protein
MLQKIVMQTERRSMIGLEQIAPVAVAAPKTPQLLAGEGEAENIAAAFGERAGAFLDHVGMGDENIRDQAKQPRHPRVGPGEAFRVRCAQRGRWRGLAADPMFGGHVIWIEAEQGVQQSRARTRRANHDQRRGNFLLGEFRIGLAIGDQAQPRGQLVGDAVDRHFASLVGHARPDFFGH